jgi:diguanylate cyclase (GGDEF)-like protein/PAS domain S-box-containing protein
MTVGPDQRGTDRRVTSNSTFPRLSAATRIGTLTCRRTRGLMAVNHSGSGSGIARPTARTPRARKRVAPRSMVSDSAIAAPASATQAPVATTPNLSQGRFDDLVSSLDAIVWEADGDDYKMTYVSPRSKDIAGYAPGEWLTQPAFWEDHLHPDDRQRAITETDAAINALKSIRVEYRFRVATGEYRWFSDVIRVIRKADGAGHRLVGVMIDITDQKRTEEALAYRAAHDTLTGLLNREQLDADLARVHDRPEPWALLFLDLNGFKDINDGLGHSVGDEVLRIIAKRLSGATRPGDTVARFGGDEFCVLACVAEEDTAVTIAHRLREAVEAPARVGGHTLRLAVTVGIAYVGPDGTPETLLRQADAAMYSAKSLGSGVAVYEPWMRKAALLRLNDTVE